MQVSQKSRYALRALFELARRCGEGPVKIADVAAAEEIPLRFLEVILSELKQGGFVTSRRGSQGGYWLAREPRQISVGEVLRFVEGSLEPAPIEQTERSSSVVFRLMWEELHAAVSGVYDNTTFQDLVDRQLELCGAFVPNYSI